MQKYPESYESRLSGGAQCGLWVRFQTEVARSICVSVDDFSPGEGCLFYVSLRDALLTSPGCVPTRLLLRHRGKAAAPPDPQTLFI